MLKIKEAVIVEGRYDKLKLSNILDAMIIETNGFSIFKDKEKLKFIRRIAKERGIIVITDSDHSGFQIRKYVSSGISPQNIKHIYIPDIYGKEKRKDKPSKEGKLGVEGMNEDVLRALFEKARIISVKSDNSNPVTNYDLFELGFSGKADSKKKRKLLFEKMGLPEFLSSNAFLGYVNTSMTKEKFYEIANELNSKFED